MVCYLPALNFFDAAIQQRWIIYLVVWWYHLSPLSSVGLLRSRSILVVMAALQSLWTGMLQSQSTGITMLKPPVSLRRTGVPSRLSFSNDSVSSRLSFSNDSVPSCSSLFNDSVSSHSSVPNDSVSSLPSQLPFIDGTVPSHLSSHDTKKPNLKTYLVQKHASCTATQILSSFEHVPRKNPRSTTRFTMHFCLLSHFVKIFSCLLPVNEYVRYSHNQFQA